MDWGKPDRYLIRPCSHRVDRGFLTDLDLSAPYYAAEIMAMPKRRMPWCSWCSCTCLFSTGSAKNTNRPCECYVEWFTLLFHTRIRVCRQLQTAHFATPGLYVRLSLTDNSEVGERSIGLTTFETGIWAVLNRIIIVISQYL